MWNPDTYLEQLYEEALNGHQQNMKSKDLEARKEFLKIKLMEALGSMPIPNENYASLLLERTECDGYIRERIELSATEGLSFPVYLLIPKKRIGKLPAVLAVHGHGYGSKEVVGLLSDGTPDEGIPSGHKHFAVQLVQRGMVVIAPEVLGFGERMRTEDQESHLKKSSCDSLAKQFMIYGKTLTGMRVSEMITVLNYLKKREEVDADKMGIMGFSGGAMIAFITSILDEMVKATVLCGYTNTFKGSILDRSHCIDNYIPGILSYAELPELIGLIAPRALFIESGEDDPLFPAASFREAESILQRTYEAEAALSNFDSDLFPGKHEVSGRKSYEWLKHAL
jgi:dienelactone hydrolase